MFTRFLGVQDACGVNSRERDFPSFTSFDELRGTVRPHRKYTPFFARELRVLCSLTSSAWSSFLCTSNKISTYHLVVIPAPLPCYYLVVIVIAAPLILGLGGFIARPGSGSHRLQTDQDRTEAEWGGQEVDGLENCGPDVGEHE